MIMANEYFASLKDIVNFYQRTANHISACIACQYIINQNILPHISINLYHDCTKINNKNQIDGYFTIHMFYNDKQSKYTKKLPEIGNIAWCKHYTEENHHPEHYTNINDMDDNAIAEMVADWMAMAYEKREDYDYYWKNIAIKRFKFNDHQIQLIDKIVTYFVDSKDIINDTMKALNITFKEHELES